MGSARPSTTVSAMRALVVGLLCFAVISAGCTGRSDCTRAADPYLDRFKEMKLRALKLLELRSSNQRQRMLARALRDDDPASLPPALKPEFVRMKQASVDLTEEDIEESEASFWRLFDLMFAEDDDVLQGEIVFVEADGSVTSFRHPRDREVPAGLRWHGLRQARTFCAFGDCLVESGTEPCLLMQIRPRDYRGSAGLTVGFSREP